MTVTINLPREAEHSLRQAWGDRLDQKALEALVIQGYRERVFSVGRVAELVGLETSIQAEQWLADRRVERNLDPEDIASDYSALDASRTPSPR
jgi:predicted HTH domain antitoxin